MERMLGWPVLQRILVIGPTARLELERDDRAEIGMRLEDLGAYGIIVPLINTAEEAAKAVAACRYPPIGMRFRIAGRPQSAKKGFTICILGDIISMRHVSRATCSPSDSAAATPRQVS